MRRWKIEELRAVAIHDSVFAGGVMIHPALPNDMSLTHRVRAGQRKVRAGREFSATLLRHGSGRARTVRISEDARLAGEPSFLLTETVGQKQRYSDFFVPLSVVF